MSRIIEHITEEHLTPDMQLVADACGIEIARKLMAELPGTRIYIPQPKRINGLVQLYILRRKEERATPQVVAKELDMTVEFVKRAMVA